MARAWNGPTDRDEVSLGVHVLDAKALGRHAPAAHAACHPSALEDATGRGASTDRAWRSQSIGLAVGAGTTTEAMTSYDTGKALTLGSSSDVDKIAFGEHVRAHFRADLEV